MLTVVPGRLLPTIRACADFSRRPRFAPLSCFRRPLSAAGRCSSVASAEQMLGHCYGQSTLLHSLSPPPRDAPPMDVHRRRRHVPRQPVLPAEPPRNPRVHLQRGQGDPHPCKLGGTVRAADHREPEDSQRAASAAHGAVPRGRRGRGRRERIDVESFVGSPPASPQSCCSDIELRTRASFFKGAPPSPSPSRSPPLHT